MGSSEKSEGALLLARDSRTHGRALTASSMQYVQVIELRPGFMCVWALVIEPEGVFG
ncbi:MAG TPA: hypothetical protein VGL10_07070 [Gammaproteobacteria bacterium]